MNPHEESGTLRQIARNMAETKARFDRAPIFRSSPPPTMLDLELKVEQLRASVWRLDGSRAIWKATAIILLIGSIYLWFDRNKAERRLRDPAYNELCAQQEAKPSKPLPN